MRLDEDPWRSLHDAEVSCHKQMYYGQQHADENTSKVSLQLQTTHGYMYRNNQLTLWGVIKPRPL